MKLFVDNLGMNFEGVARSEGKVYFVPYALPNEEVEAEVIEDKGKFAKTELKQIISKSSLRVQPFCPYFYNCGGCDLQHLLYESSLKEKSKKIKETLLKVAGLTLDVDDTVPSKDAFFYRNKGAFPIVNSKIGMFRGESHELLEINQCFLMKNEIQTVFSIVKNFINKKGFSGYNFETHTGDLKYLVVRAENNSTLVCLVATHYIDGLDELLDLLAEKIENVGLYLNINTQKNSTILGKNYFHLGGIKDIEMCEFGINYSVAIASFLQVNTDIKNKIYNKIMSILQGDVVIDAYAGAGLLSAMVAKNAKMVYSVEIVKQASEKAIMLVKNNDIKNMNVINGDCTIILPKLAKELKKFSLILDPARVGCGEKVMKIASLADKIVYLSCNPIALAKDLKILQKSHTVVSVTPFDMFPQTKHVETVVVLEKNNK